MFWMDTCPHCHFVLDEVLPPLQEKYGDQLQLLLIEVKSEQEWNWLVQTGTSFGMSQDHLGVPFLVIGNRVLIGSDQIPAELPGLIEEHLAAGGLDYPAMPGLSEVLSTATPAVRVPTDDSLNRRLDLPPSYFLSIGYRSNHRNALNGRYCSTGSSGEAQLITPHRRPALQAHFRRRSSARFEFAIKHYDRHGRGASLHRVAAAKAGFQNASTRPTPPWLDLAIPVLAIAGLGVAGYLAYVETQAVAAVCGPVGDCNAVQSSPYARLFGLLPIGVLGVIGYVAILAAWLWGRFRVDPLARYAPLVVFGLALVGTLFSLYLTYLEPFVIKAVCIWCLTSAIIITLLLLLSHKPAFQAMNIHKS